MTEDLSSFIVRLLLRYFRRGEKQQLSSFNILDSDRELLLLQWSISDKVTTLCRYILEHPHEQRAVLQAKTVVSSGSIRGRLRSAETVIAQIGAGDPTLFVADEPFRSFDSGPNRVLGWTLRYATLLSRRFRSLLPPESNYADYAMTALRLLDDVHHRMPEAVEALPPSPYDIRTAAMARQPLYRMAADAFMNLRAVERLESDALAALLQCSLVGPMEQWRQFELALALAMAGEISKRTGSEMRLNTIVPSGSSPLIEVGDYAVLWQKAAPSYKAPTLDGWELLTNDIICEYGISPGYDRPDVVVYDVRSNEVLAVGEAKYFESDSWRERLRDAVVQVVMYARGYGHVQDVHGLIGRSIIALWSAGEVPNAKSDVPTVATYTRIVEGLAAWGDRCFHPV